jgi:hypothetical protein
MMTSTTPSVLGYAMIGPISPSILEIDISGDVRLPDDYDDGPFAVPDFRSDPDLPDYAEEERVPL